jgi:tRNA(Ile)-lysidine synthase
VSAPTRLRHRVGRAIAAHRMWSPGDDVAVAVSGGLDSVVLLDLLVATRRWHGASLRVVTVDHGVREGSAADARFVEGLAAELGLPCTTVRPAVPPAAGEAQLRDARYAAFEALGADRIALGHHRDDLAETVILQLLRGTGTAGLAGMRPVRGRYVRPQLDATRAELRAWAERRGLAWREDPTNADPRFARNRVRAEVMPLLELIRPGAGRALARSAQVAAQDDAWLESLVVPGPPWDLAFVQRAPEPVVRRSLLRGLPGIGAGTMDALLAVAARGRGRIEVLGGWVAVDNEQLVFTPRESGAVGPTAESDEASREAPTLPEPDVTCSST